MYRISVPLLPGILLTGCSLEAEGFLGADDILIIPLSLGDVAPLATLCLVAFLLLLQACIPVWRHVVALRFKQMFRRLSPDSVQLLAVACTCSGFTTGLSLLPLCLALYEDTFYPHIAGPLNPGKAIFALQQSTCPLMLAGLLLVALSTFCRWLWLRRRAY